MLTWWDTASVFDELRRLQREMDRLFGQLGTLPRARPVFPLVNIYDNGETFLLRAEIPGVDPKALDVTATGDTVTITGERPLEEPEGASYHRRERDHGTFSRSIKLPEPIDPGKIKASYKNGVLEVRVPRAAEAKPRKVKVEG